MDKNIIQKFSIINYFILWILQKEERGQNYKMTGLNFN